MSRVLCTGGNPLELMTRKPKANNIALPKDGIIDSLSYHLHSKIFIKPWSLEDSFVAMPTKAFQVNGSILTLHYLVSLSTQNYGFKM